MLLPWCKTGTREINVSHPGRPMAQPCYIEVLPGLLHPAMPYGQLLAGSMVSIPLPLKWN